MKQSDFIKAEDTMEERSQDVAEHTGTAINHVSSQHSQRAMPASSGLSLKESINPSPSTKFRIPMLVKTIYF